MWVHPKSCRLRRGLIFRAAAAGLLLILGGCVVGPKYQRPPVQTPAAFKETSPQQADDGSVWRPARPNENALRGNWWEIYNEPELNAMETKLNAANQNIAESLQNFMAARAQVREARSNYFPTATVSPSYTRTRSSQNLFGSSSSGTSTSTGTTTNNGSGNTTFTGGASSGGGLYSNDFELPFDVSWEPDLWGKVQNTVREYANAAQVSAADLANTRLSEQASLAMYYFELRGQDTLQDLYDQAISAYRESLKLTQVRKKMGVDDEQAVAEAVLNLKNAEASATNVGLSRAQYEHAIALLVGEPASTFRLPRRALATTLPAIPLGLPSDLLERRPDVAAAERTMSEENALIGVETAAFYPTVTLSLEGGFESSSLSKWFMWPSRFFSFGPSASQTLFDAGLRQATVEQYTALYQADVASYRQTVLTAFQQTEDYVAAVRILTRQHEQQLDAVQAAKDYYNLAQKRYRLGLDPYLDVFTAETSLLSDEQTDISLRVQQMNSSVQLIEALGGGWSSTKLPSERNVGSTN